MCSYYRRLFAGLILTASSQAVEAEGLLEVFRQAAINDPQLKAAAATCLATLEIEPQARALLLPQISAGAQLDRNFSVDPGPDSAFNSHSYSLNLSQPLFRQGARVQQRLADSIVNQAQADFLAAQQALILRVAERYFDVLAELDNLSFREAEQKAIARQLEQASRRFEVGLITITDVHEAQAAFDLSEAEVITAGNQLSDSLEALREVTGQYYEKLNELEEEIPLTLPEPADPEAWVVLAIANNPQLLSAAFAVEAARENINLQRADRYPTVDLVASHFDSDSDRGNNISGNAIGLRLNILLYQGGAIASRTREAAYSHEAAKQGLENQQRFVIRQVRNAYRGLEAAISRVNALNQARISNQSALEATEAGFDVGTRTIVDVLNAQQELYRARRDYAQSRYDYILNKLRLQQAAGQLAEADLIAVSTLLQDSAPPEALTLTSVGELATCVPANPD